jgi:hypothetical protein
MTSGGGSSTQARDAGGHGNFLYTFVKEAMASAQTMLGEQTLVSRAVMPVCPVTQSVFDSGSRGAA